LDFDLFNSEETDEEHKGINYHVNRNEVDHVLFFNQHILVPVKANVIQKEGDVGINSCNWVRWLLFSNIVRVPAVCHHRLGKLDIVNGAHQIVLAVTEATSKPFHADKCVNSFKEEHELAHLHKADANLEIVGLYILK